MVGGESSSSTSTAINISILKRVDNFQRLNFKSSEIYPVLSRNFPTLRLIKLVYALYKTFVLKG